MSRPGTDPRVAIFVLLLITGVMGTFLYWRMAGDETPGAYNVRKGNYRLEDGQHEEAIREFQLALDQNPEHQGARLGIAVTYTQMNRLEEAVAEYDAIIDADPDYSAAYANRGIVLDRMGRVEEALSDYRKALELEPRLDKGPGWIWRFLRNIDKKPPTISDRADYLEAELAKPPEERLLQLPEEDEKQRMYKVK